MTPYLLMLSISCNIWPSAFTLNGWFRNSRRRSISISTIFSSGSISFTLTGISTPSFLHIWCICFPAGLKTGKKETRSDQIYIVSGPSGHFSGMSPD
jgi:hypothetical protein